MIVSTDAEAYAAIAREYGAETPLLRPAGHATDNATDLQVFRHALEWLGELGGYRPDPCVHLRPKYRSRRSTDVDGAVAVLGAHPEWGALGGAGAGDSVQDVVETARWHVAANHLLCRSNRRA